ncbi:uncharacterized protein BN753_02091 [Clostridium sp. CAG:678]|nr:uncharacterized protein BN753_02091 [Clostridium sp. CAG:678]
MNVKKKPSKRILAAFLALLMILTMGQTGMIGAFAAEQGYTVTVTNSETSDPVEGATLTVISAKDVTNFDVVKADETFTDDDNDGDIEIAAIAEYLESNPDAEISFSFTVSAKDYQTSDTQFIYVRSENLEDGFSVALKQNPTVTVNVADEDAANISAYLLADKDDKEGTEINISDDTADFVPVGSFVKFEIQDKSNYITEITATNGGEKAEPVISEEITYVYEITDDFVLDVEYTAETYTLSVTYHDAEGTVTADDSVSGTLPGEVTVSKSETQTVFTITPNSQYKISGIFFNDANKENNLAPTNAEDREKSYSFSVDNTSIAAGSSNTLDITFELRTFTITVSQVVEGRGTVTVCDENGNIEPSANNPQSYEVLSGTTITLNFEGNEDYKLVNLSSDDPNKQQLFSEVVENTYTFSVDKDIAFTVDFNKIDSELLVGVPLDSIFDVQGAKLVDGVYYSSESSVTITPKKTIIYNGETILENVSRADLFFDGEFHEAKLGLIKHPITIDKDTTITPLQIYSGNWFSCDSDAVMKIVFDTTDPVIGEINGLPDEDERVNTNRTVSFTVTDELSGVDSVQVTNDYNPDEKVTCSPNNEGVYEFTVPVRTDYTGSVTYTVTATDNVGKFSKKEFTVQNDTESPILSENEENQPPILFKNNDGDFFHHLLNAISFGKLGTEKTTIDFAVSDGNGVGFGGSSYVEVMFVPDGKKVGSDGNIIKTSVNGSNSVSITADDLKGTFKGTIYYKLTDDLGNTTSEWQMITSANSNILSEDATSGTDISLVMIENIKPTITITPSSISDESYVNSENKTIYNGDASFTVNMNDQNSGLYSYAVTINGKTQNDKEEPELFPSEEKIQDEGKPVYEKTVSLTTENLTANEDGSFVVEVTVIDNSGNVNEETCTVYKDTTAPVITNFEFDTEDGSGYEEGAKNAVEVIDYGFYFKKNVKVTISANDPEVSNEITSGVQSITYKIDGIDAKGNSYTNEETVNVQDATTSFSIEVAKGFKGQIYAFATDNVNNSGSYVHPDGTVVESLDKHSESSSIVITAPQPIGTQNTNYSYYYDLNQEAVADTELSYPDSTVQVPLYNSDPTFDVTVSDSYSGIRNVKWTVIEGGASTSKEISVDNTGQITNNTDAQWSIPNGTMDANLVTQLTGSVPVTGNYNDMVLVVELTDRAGNVSYDYYTFGIDKTAPVISVSYNNNNADQRSGNTYFDADRTATIVIEERNFNAENVVVNVTKDGRTYPVTLSWRNENGTEHNGDDTRHITTITYDSDGDYTFSVSYTDRAQNRNNGVNYGNSVAPTAFTVDKTAPVISVTYNNNNAQNGHYFRSDRTATIVITEHNFDVNRVVFTRTASLNGSNITIPSVSWNNNGDVHTATIHYTADGDYTFNIAMDDMAGNTNNGVDYGASVAANSFTVDKTINVPVITFSDKENGGAADDEDKRSFNDIVRPIITVNDVNYGSVNVELSRIVRNGTQGDLQSLLAIPNGNGTFTSENFPEKIENDGIYSFSVTLTDLAGNTQTADEVFTVNRFGSVYVFNDVLNAAIENNYNQSISGNVVITEYNADPISKEMIQVTRDGSPVSLDDNVSSKTGNTRAEDGWYQNTYTIPQSAFAADGIYNIYISSVDNSGNTPEMSGENIYYGENKLEGKDASFIIDATKPQIVNVYSDEVELSGDQAIINAESLILKYEISDNIAIDTIEVHKGINDPDPQKIVMDKVIEDSQATTSADGENRNYTSYIGDIKVENGFNEDEIYFVITDKAGNVINTSSENTDENTAYDLGTFKFLNNITVDTNPFVLWFANKPLFWGSIGALAAILIGVFLIIFFKKRKKNDDEEKAES